MSQPERTMPGSSLSRRTVPTLPTVLIACPPHPVLEPVVSAAKSHGVVVARTDDPSQAERWLGVLQPDLVVAPPDDLARLTQAPLAAHCRPLPWQGDAQALRNALAHWVPELADPLPLLKVGPLRVDEARGLVGRDLPAGRLIQAEVPPVELRLLVCLARQPGRLITRQELQERVWPPHAQPQPRTVDQVVRRLRKVLAAIGLPDLVRAQRGLGYQLDLPSTRSPAPFPSL
ncbi:MAG: winged helix-turn-helix domain-containing protein [Inhella sp.]